ncbi:CAF17-like 4Fe-4S cluster assembly/insertion protein YgfZ [Aquicella lusitana]|uniref:Uncharacterized protein n=1 Tax=Aquicella lusitana TaxID=254246 RepID=A0A370GYU1_9COXI|nr:folate-binding protein YgfZ [Aquicella lusitana]RDI48799.1 hypothetical protein C8D86_10178 [Aquicella lusitana]VVC73227.1 tRNA-modifying protein YgfZ [Aquicella lusitana]
MNTAVAPSRLFNLHTYGVLKASGPDVTRLLQGQLTCDVEKISPTQSRLGAHCNPQGRIISLFWLYRSKDAYYLLMPHDHVPVALAALKKYAIFYKATLADVSDNYLINGYAGSIKTIASFNDLMCINMPSSPLRHIIFGPAEAIKTHLAFLSSQAEPASANAWKCLDIADHLPAIYPETTAKLLPHEINLPALQAVSFEKGCYTGQEIIARMHYKGKLKNHLYHAELISQDPPKPGATIYYQHQNDIKPCGIIVDSCLKDYNHCSVLIVTDESNAKNNHLFLDHNHHHYFVIQD